MLKKKPLVKKRLSPQNVMKIVFALRKTEKCILLKLRSDKLAIRHNFFSTMVRVTLNTTLAPLETSYKKSGIINNGTSRSANMSSAIDKK